MNAPMKQEHVDRGLTVEDSMAPLDPASRRRLQNRLNQRASRERKQAEKKRQKQEQRWVIYTNEAKAFPVAEDIQLTSVPKSTPPRETPRRAKITRVLPFVQSEKRRQNSIWLLQERK
ncbi:uncharacterized protein N7482_007284 [Penicillium canariense]|uniref:BZIP domain-containing protein n=1 Tax=Penicillium canariense TaxID=189055 RepID=A0A9W9LJQ3_9EURO|nr:uncharacterized protein N7482_007284 [Penicillium canariense]KAJ5160280.1 hypothetical protein N7482_007284 [Penicillium canariense]